jgi:hypothetical protein
MSLPVELQDARRKSLRTAGEPAVACVGPVVDWVDGVDGVKTL